MKKLLQLTFALLATMNSFAQNSGSVTGVVLDEKNEILPFTNVLLLKAKDSTLAKAVTSDIEGKYLIENAPFNQYLLKISMVGYGEIYTPKFILNEANPNFKFEPIKLSLQTQMLKEVSVTAKKPFIEQQIDKTVVNVENSIVASGNTLLEILEKSPGVVVDRQNNALKLKNKDGVMVMIDGRRNFLSNEALIQFLSNLNSEQVASIEIITNPSSKYDAQGNSGIINIKLKKNLSFGTNGTLTVSAGNTFLPDAPNDLYRLSTNLSLNHRNKKWNIYGNINPGKNTWYNDNTLVRSTNYEGLRSEFNQKSQRNGSGVFTNGKIGADYFLSNKTTLGAMIDVNNWSGSGISSGLTNIVEIKNQTRTASSLIPGSTNDNDNFNVTANMNLKHNFNDKGKELTVDLDYSGFNNTANTNFENKFYDANNKLTDNLVQRNPTSTIIDILAAKFDFSIPTKNKAKLDFGAKSSYVKTDNDFVFEQMLDNNWINDDGKTNRFVYKEFVNAAYVNYGRQWKKVGLQSGLRAEYTISEGNSLTLNKVVPKEYLSLFPTLFVNHNISEKHATRYSYSRRIGRPNYQQLNPFLFFLDPYTFQKGNEFLNPQFTDNAEFTYSYKGASSISFGYSFTKDNMFDVIEQEDETRKTFQTTTNLEKVENFSVNVSFPVTVTKWWTMNNNISGYYNRYRDSNVSGGVLDIGNFAYNFYTGNTFSLKKGWSAEANMWYNSPNIFGIIRATKPQYAVNAGVQKVLNKKARLKLNVNDMFLTSFFNGKIDYQNIDLAVTNRWSSRRATLSFTYNFGNQNVKSARRRSTAAEDLKSRVGGGQG
ncbi:outer membrane beta-barrel family protein [Lacihabitans soyangensis]|uniref:TonB-dependent receptor n=1 Tax=Lacihabitans soyangensis TaxID=869394 RepID=A0AAE3H4H9_9BACT|nr:outer membrane beta-barrel family protein [Lacihabitans soyangensis]MCP9763756.1 TonB-dependent receptor [Lacihabitans soyangensis]